MIFCRRKDVWLSRQREYNYDQRMDEIVDWLQNLQMDIVFAYFSEPAVEGRRYGPDSAQYKTMVNEKALCGRGKCLNLFFAR